MEEEPKKVVAGTENRPLSEFEIREETKAKLITSGIKELFPIQAATFEHVSPDISHLFPRSCVPCSQSSTEHTQHSHGWGFAHATFGARIDCDLYR